MLDLTSFRSTLALARSLESAPDTVIPDHPAWKRGPPVATEHISGYGGYLPGSIDHDFGRFVPPRHTEKTVTPRTYAAATHWSKEREALVDKAYNQLDANGDGTITFEDLRLLYLVDDGAMEEKGKKEIGTFTRFLDTFVSLGGACCVVCYTCTPSTPVTCHTTPSSAAPRPLKRLTMELSKLCVAQLRLTPTAQCVTHVRHTLIHTTIHVLYTRAP